MSAKICAPVTGERCREVSKAAYSAPSDAGNMLQEAQYRRGDERCALDSKRAMPLLFTMMKMQICQKMAQLPSHKILRHAAPVACCLTFARPAFTSRRCRAKMLPTLQQQIRGAMLTPPMTRRRSTRSAKTPRARCRQTAIRQDMAARCRRGFYEVYDAARCRMCAAHKIDAVSIRNICGDYDAFITMTPRCAAKTMSRRCACTVRARTSLRGTGAACGHVANVRCQQCATHSVRGQPDRVSAAARNKTMA